MSAVALTRIFATFTAPLDYMHLDRAYLIPKLSMPAVRITDDLGREHSVEPPAPYNIQYTIGLAITIPLSCVDLLNSVSATTRRPLGGQDGWLDNYVVTGRAEMIVLASTSLYTRPAAGEAALSPNAVALKPAYKGIFDTVPPEMLGLHNSLGGQSPRYVSLSMLVTDQGTWSDFDNPLSVTWLGGR